MSKHGVRAFADESKQADYILAVFEVPESRYATARQRILMVSKQISRFPFHCHSLRPSERSKVMTEFELAFGESVTLFISSAKYRDRARHECLNAAVELLTNRPTRTLTLELDRTIERSDRATIHQALVRIDRVGSLQYDHAETHVEPCLSVPDFVAWNWQRGGRERARIRNLIRDIHHV